MDGKFRYDFGDKEITSSSLMFKDCTEITSLDLSKFNSTQCTNIGGMFYGCSNLESINFSNFNTSRVTNLSALFYECSKLKYLDLSGFDTSNVTGSNFFIFHKCSSLETLNLGGWDFSGITSVMLGMFDYCNSLTTILGPVTGINNAINLTSSPLLSLESALVLIDGLSEVSEKRTLSLPHHLSEIVPPGKIEEAVNKGWDLAWG